MLKLPQLTAQDLQIYKGKKVVFYDVFNHQKACFDVFKRLNIEVIACCAEKISLENFLVMTVEGIALVKPNKLEQYANKNDNIIMQGNGYSFGSIGEIEEKAKKLGVPISPIPMDKILSDFTYLNVFATIKSPVKSLAVETYWRYNCYKKIDTSWKRFKKEAPQTPIILCLPPKTADVTLTHTFKQLSSETYENNAQVRFKNIWHRPRFINQAECEKNFGTFKIIIALREPIAQNLSAFYQVVTKSKISYDWVYGAIQNKSKVERAKIIQTYEHLATVYGDDVQMLWDAYIVRYLPNADNRYPTVTETTIQAFIRELQENVIDITQYPFNKEKGYTCFKNGNTEFFVYQLEKLNSLVPELSAWVGVPFDKLKKGNESNDKWIAESYKQAQKEIKISQEYFDECFNEPYVKHCYSEEDIENFKEKWRPHIKR